MPKSATLTWPVAGGFPCQPLRTAFGKSLCFTRGWTLQELLASHEPVLFSQDWVAIVDRTLWKRDISEITYIYGAALAGDTSNLHSFSMLANELGILQGSYWRGRHRLLPAWYL